MKKCQFLTLSLSLVGCLLTPGILQAQNKEPIKLVVGFAPGGTSDSIARILADSLSQELGAAVIVENKAGAGGRLAAEFVKNAKPDSKTYLIGPDGWAIFPSAMYSPKTLRYDIEKDLRPVAQLVSYPLALVVNSKVPASTIKEFEELMKTNNGQSSFGTPAPGGQIQFVGWVVGQTLGAEFTPVPYKGNAPLLNDLLGDQISSAILPVSHVLQYGKDKIKVLGIMSDQRWELAPDFPTFKEQGYQLEVKDAWQGMWAHGQAPKEEVVRMETALRKILMDPAIKEKITSTNLVSPNFVAGEKMAKDLSQDIVYWRQVIEKSGYIPD